MTDPTYPQETVLAVAHVLFAGSTYRVGSPATGVFDLLSGEARARYLRLAERALRSTDPEHQLDAMRDVADQIEEWMNGPYGGPGTEPTPREIALEAVGRYEQALSGWREPVGDGTGVR